ncbi:MAG: protoporphyrinogen oxidase [Myxococcales bacterium]|nr:protoporphyrinogen oxidase [Myxococcales bacterium]
MSDPEVGVVVAGAGIAGLAAALQLQLAGEDVLVVDASDRPGGVMRTDHVSGYVIERGPNTTHVKAPMLDFLRALGAEKSLLAARPASRLRLIYDAGQLRPVPTSPLALLRTPLLSVGGKLRLLAEPFVRRAKAGDESVAEFIGRRLGKQVVEGLVGPFLTGVYAGDERELGAEAVFPSLVEMERKSGSIVCGAIAGLFRRGRRRGLRGSYSAVEGLGPFARALAERLVEPVALENRVIGVKRDGDGWLVRTSGPAGKRRVRAMRVVLAVPADQAAKILRGVSSDLADELAAIEYAPIVGLSLGVDPGAVREKIEGFGFLVPRRAEIKLLGCLYMSQLFPLRAPAGRELLQCLAGGARWPEAVDLPDDEIVTQVCADLDRILGLREEPRILAVTRWRQAIPQPRRDHVARIARIRERLLEFPGIALAGSYLGGIGVSDSLESGLLAARDVATRSE